MLPNRTGSIVPFLPCGVQGGLYMTKLCAKLYSALVYIHACPSLSGSRHVTEPGQDPKLFCSEGFVKAPSEQTLNHFLSSVFLTSLTTVTHSGVANYLPCPITPSVRPKEKYITCFILTTTTPKVTVGMRWCHECINCAADQFPHSAFYTVALWTCSYFSPPCAWLSRFLSTFPLKRTHHWQRQWTNFVGLFFHLCTTDTRSTRPQINGYGQFTHAEGRAPQHASQ